MPLRNMRLLYGHRGQIPTGIEQTINCGRNFGVFLGYTYSILLNKVPFFIVSNAFWYDGLI